MLNKFLYFIFMYNHEIFSKRQIASNSAHPFLVKNV